MTGRARFSGTKAYCDDVRADTWGARYLDENTGDALNLCRLSRSESMRYEHVQVRGTKLRKVKTDC